MMSLVPLPGCATQVLEQSQRLQLAAMRQYRGEMAAYHEKVKAYMCAEKRDQLDAALAASLAQAADGQGRVPVSTAMEKVQKRDALQEEFQGNVARLDAEFAERQAAMDRAIDLAEETLDLVSAYDRLGVIVRSLFVREAEAEELVRSYGVQEEPK